MQLRNSALLHGLWLTLAAALVLPGEALAGWGNENWGTMVWGQGASPPALPALGIVGLTLLAMSVAGAAAWTLRMSRPAVGATLMLVVLAIPLVVVAGTVGELETFVNGTTADADQVNANFDAVETAVNDNDSRITAAQSTADTGVVDAESAQGTANTALTTAQAAAAASIVSANVNSAGVLELTLGDGTVLNAGTVSAASDPVVAQATWNSMIWGPFPNGGVWQ